MALIKCPECGKEISEFASNCPNCGFFVKKQISSKANNNTSVSKKKLLFSVLLVLAIFLIIFLCIIIPTTNKNPFIYLNNETTKTYLWDKLGHPDKTYSSSIFLCNDEWVGGFVQIFTDQDTLQIKYDNDEKITHYTWSSLLPETPVKLKDCKRQIEKVRKAVVKSCDNCNVIHCIKKDGYNQEMPSGDAGYIEIESFEDGCGGRYSVILQKTKGEKYYIIVYYNYTKK